MECGVVGAQVGECLPYGVECRSRGYDPDGCIGRIEFDDVESVGGTVGANDLGTGSVEVGLGVQAGGRRTHRALTVDERSSLPMNLGNDDVDVDVAAVD